MSHAPLLAIRNRSSDLLDGHGGGDRPLLTAAEEIELGYRSKAGDRHARDELVLANLRLVIRIATSYLGRGLELEDLAAEGNLGLIRAAEDFDPTLGVRFSTYASHWINQAIRNALITTTATIRLPAHLIRLVGRYRHALNQMTQATGEPPSFERVVASLAISPAQVAMLEKALRTLRLKPGEATEEFGFPLRDVRDRGHDDPSEDILAHEDRDRLRASLARLDERSRSILELRYGLDGSRPLTLRELSQRLGTSRQWARKLEDRALRELSTTRPKRRQSASRDGARSLPLSR